MITTLIILSVMKSKLYFLYHHFSTFLEYHSQEVITLLGAVKSRFVFFYQYILSYNPNFCVSYILKGLQLECGKTAFCYSPFRVIHYNFVSIALEDVFYDVVDYDEWNDTNY